MSNSLLSVRDLVVNFKIHQNKRWPWSKPRILHAVNGISFDLEIGQTLGVVGESGCGKSTLIRTICGLNTPCGGQVRLAGEAIDYADRHSILRARKQMQMIFQDPIASLNPRMNIREIISEPLAQAGFKGNSTVRVEEMLERVGIARRNLGRYPHEFSGGQCQRIGIARALITAPKILLCDEPVSALDVSVQAQVVNLLRDLQKDMGLAMIFVAHNLSVVRHISDHIMVMYLGGMMEYGKAGDIVRDPRHPYTQALLSAIPIADPSVKLTPQILEGELQSALDLPAGCLFSTRCPKSHDKCTVRPELKNVNSRKVSCVFA